MLRLDRAERLWPDEIVLRMNAAEVLQVVMALEDRYTTLVRRRSTATTREEVKYYNERVECVANLRGRLQQIARSK